MKAYTWKKLYSGNFLKYISDKLVSWWTDKVVYNDKILDTNTGYKS